MEAQNEHPDTNPSSAPPPATLEQMTDLLYTAWTIIANAGGGDWAGETPDWQEAATSWRDKWHRLGRRFNAPREADSTSADGDVEVAD
jgi:hypothetical protein